MVGVPRSRGCLLCVRRHVRCDQGRPGCTRCSVYGADCPGYDRIAKFVEVKHRVRRPGEESAGAVRAPEARSALPATVAVPRAAFINSMLVRLQTDSTEAAFWGAWFNHAPSRLGRKATLDSAVCAFAMHVLGKVCGDTTLVCQSRQLYGQSLAALQLALNHPVEWRSSETLFSAVFLCLYELYSDTGGNARSWTKHAQGLARLVQLRGVDSYIEAWNRSMLQSFMITMNALFSDQDCFLAQKKWQRAICDAIDAADSNPKSAVRLAIGKLFAHMTRLPTVLHHAWNIRMARRRGRSVNVAVAVTNANADTTDATLLHRKATRLRADLLVWFERARSFLGESIYTEVPADLRLVAAGAPVSPYPTVLYYADPWMGALYVSYLASMLIVQEALNQCAAVRDAAYPVLTSTSRPFAESNRQFCNVIYRSLENLGRGITGPYRIGFSMRIAYEFADLPTQLWIRALLDHSAQIYASSRSSTYPPPTSNEFNYC